jgi:hypothetical protein
MRRLRWDVVLVALGATLIVGATLAHPPAAVSAAAGVAGFLLVLAGAYLSLRGLRTPGGPPPGGGFWGGGGGEGPPPSGGHGHHGGGFWGGGHGGGHGGGGGHGC